MEAQKRRSRVRRVSSGKRVELTERDLELFKLLSRYRYLRSDFLYAFLGGRSETRFKERLGALYHDGRYINRPEQQWQFANARYMPAAYELDDKGEQVLRERGLTQIDSPLFSKGRPGVQHQFAHQIMICEIIALIELAARQRPDLRFVSWQEILAKAPERTRALANPFDLPTSITYSCPRHGRTHHADITIVPDGIFGLEYAQRENQKSYRFFALEADRGTMPVRRSNLSQSSYLRKLLGYQHILAQNIHRSQLGVPNLFVLNISPSAAHTASIMKLAEKLSPEQRSRLFLFKTVIGRPSQNLLSESWLRVGYDAFRIDEP